MRVRSSFFFVPSSVHHPIAFGFLVWCCCYFRLARLFPSLYSTVPQPATCNRKKARDRAFDTVARKRPKRKMLSSRCSSAPRSRWEEIFLLVFAAAAAVAEGFFQSAVVVPQQQQLRPTAAPLDAIAIPHDSPAWISTPLDRAGGSAASSSSRTKRINQVLEKASSRTGLANANSGVATRTEKVGETCAEVSSPSRSIGVDEEGSIDTVLPFELPTLSDVQIDQLLTGEIIQEQSEMGRQGSGFVVQVRTSTKKYIFLYTELCRCASLQS